MSLYQEIILLMHAGDNHLGKKKKKEMTTSCFSRGSCHAVIWVCIIMTLKISLCFSGFSYPLHHIFTWRRHQMETFSVLLALCARNSTVTGEFPSQSPVMQSFDVFVDLRLNKPLNKQSQVEAGDLRRHRTHYDVTVMKQCSSIQGILMHIQYFVVIHLTSKQHLFM